ncbi:hypothetical protein [Ruegeria lacuscaerulensis]|uniref:hypothetical protein n=1 Tax=Ruegeria lacuscaerulensis TaxID=55218 RepID=UPI00147999E6|nr:hypothetical protein [Ruegeria lacuscaerulensis]
MTDFEKRTLKLFVITSAFVSVIALAFGITYENGSAIATGSLVAAVSVLVAFLGLAQFCAEKLRDYGLGEGTEHLYGKAHAKRVFGENYKKPLND